MDTQAFDKLERLFQAARVLSGEERAAFVEVACQGEDALRKELESLLQASQEAEQESFLPRQTAVLEVFDEPQKLTGQQFGPYKLIEPLGEGGMGEVWLAEQKEPIKRKVAFKLIKAGMDTKEVVARFDSERQALAMMDHPNIAKVLDSGVTSTGRPYFVMEFVRGVPVNEYCDQKRLSTTDRIRLFMDICRAVQHAHQKGIIHRDLKPSNVIITEHDDKPVPKVIDFGIAKAVGYNLTMHTLITGMGQLIGTPAYMSPEQANQNGFDVDTRTDVYSLGIMLYELLVGSKPLDLKEKALHAIQDAIANSQVPKPSTRLTSLGNVQDTIAAQRQTTPEQLKRELKGDLDWIVLKSIEKDRTRRYETVNGLAMELQRYLRNEPVTARPPSVSYRMSKFVRRHQTGVIAGTLVFLALIGGITAATIGLVRAQKAEEVAQQEALTAQSVSDFMIQMFQVSDPSVARGNSITAREILDQGAERIESELQEQPIVRARMLHTMGQVYWELGLEDESRQMLQEAVDLRKETLGDNHPDVAETLRVLAEVHSRHFGGITNERRIEILSLLEEAKAIHEEAYGPNHPEVAQDWSLIAQMTLERLVRDDYDSARYDDAIHAGKKAVEIWEENYGPDDPELHKMLYRLGGWYRGYLEDYDTASDYYERSIAIIEKNYGANSGLMMEPLYGLFRVEYAKDLRSPTVFEAFQRMDGISDEEIINSDAYPSLFITTASYLQAIGEMDAAEASLERAARLLEKKFGPDVEDMIFAHYRLVQLYVAENRWEEVEETALWTVPLWLRNNRTHDAANAHFFAGMAQTHLGKFDEAEASYTKALEIYEEGSPRFDLPTVLWELSNLYRKQGQISKALQTEEKMRAAGLATSQREIKRSADDRIYAMMLMGCRELWKIRMIRFDCNDEPFDTAKALEYAEKTYERAPETMLSEVVMALANYYDGKPSEAVKYMELAMTHIHDDAPTMRNFEYWMQRFNE